MWACYGGLDWQRCGQVLVFWVARFCSFCGLTVVGGLFVAGNGGR